MDDIVTAFQQLEDADLHVVAALKGVDYDVVYMREDVEGLYDKADLDNAQQNIMANQISSDDFASLGPLGDFRG